MCFFPSHPLALALLIKWWSLTSAAKPLALKVPLADVHVTAEGINSTMKHSPHPLESDTSAVECLLSHAAATAFGPDAKAWPADGLVCCRPATLIFDHLEGRWPQRRVKSSISAGPNVNGPISRVGGFKRGSCACSTSPLIRMTLPPSKKRKEEREQQSFHPNCPCWHGGVLLRPSTNSSMVDLAKRTGRESLSFDRCRPHVILIVDIVVCSTYYYCPAFLSIAPCTLVLQSSNSLYVTSLL